MRAEAEAWLDVETLRTAPAEVDEGASSSLGYPTRRTIYQKRVRASRHYSSASARQMKLRNSLFRMMLCSASTLHLAVDAKSRSPAAQFFLDQVARRPQFKAGSFAVM